jgi:hypothetical protein
MMWAKGQSLMKALQEDAEESEISVIELNGWASKVTLDIIGVAGLGRKFNAVEKGKDPLAGIYEELLDPNGETITFAMLCMVIGRNVISMVPWRMNGIFDRLTSSLNDLCRPMIEEKKIAIAEKGDDHFDVLSLLMKSGLLTDEALKDQLLTFLAAGYVTSFVIFEYRRTLTDQKQTRDYGVCSDLGMLPPHQVSRVSGETSQGDQGGPSRRRTKHVRSRSRRYPRTAASTERHYARNSTNIPHRSTHHAPSAPRHSGWQPIHP